MKKFYMMPNGYETIIREKDTVASDYPVSYSSFEMMKRCRGNMNKFMAIISKCGMGRS